MSELKGSLSVQGDVLALELNDLKLVCALPRGPIGPAGRDGMSIRGDKGEVGEKGDPGRDGRDSVIPGPKGDVGAQGGIGKCPVLRMGNVKHGDDPDAIISRDSDELYTLHLTLPRGQAGPQGFAGRDGKHGTHEKITYNCFGTNPMWAVEMFSCHFIADGCLTLPYCNEEDCGKWFMVKTLTQLSLSGLVEGVVCLNKNEGGKFVVVPYNGQYLFTRF
jgi:hypothetical protein